MENSTKYSEEKSSGGNPEQVVYANILEKGMLFGLAVLFITFAIYVSGIMHPMIPLGELSNYWGMSVGDYLHETGAPDGWTWMSMLGKGDILNFIGIAILAGLTILCYAAIVPLLLKKKDTVYAVIAILEVVVLTVAASGIIASGH
jgi:hypothetical protein